MHSILNKRPHPLCDLIRESKLAIMSDGVKLGNIFESNINVAQDFRNEPTKPLIDGTSVSDYLRTIAKSVDLERKLLPLKSDLLQSLTISLSRICVPKGSNERCEEKQPWNEIRPTPFDPLK